MPKPKQSKKADPKMAQNAVADQILALLDDGQLPPWDRPWRMTRQGTPSNAISKRPYTGINVWLTQIAQELAGYDDNRWLTFNQAKQAGGTIMKGEKSTRVILWKIIKKEDPDDPDRTTSRPLAIMYRVFNVEQTSGCDLPPLPELPEPADPIAQAEAIVAGMPDPPQLQTYRYDNHSPRYIPSLDTVQVPDLARYEQPELYYNTIYHELTHSTGHPSRLHRFETDRKSDLHQYGVEELVAGMGSAMLADLAGISHATLVPDASYIKSWADTIKADRSIVITAAQRSQKAVDYITGQHLSCSDTSQEDSRARDLTPAGIS